VEARELARALLVAGVLVLLLSAFLFIAAPSPGGAMFATDYAPPLWTVALPWIGILMPIVGLVWMVAIYRRAFNPEPDQDAWRYRAD